jgi:hypothetical protein
VANGGNWDRFWFTIMGFRADHGRWPTRVLWPRAVQDAVESHLNPADLARLKAKLVFVSAVDLSAEDDSGAHYDYSGPAGGGHRLERQAWFGIDWD